MTSTPTRPVDNVVIATKGLQDRDINILAGTTVENKGKLILMSGDQTDVVLNSYATYYSVRSSLKKTAKTYEYTW